MYKKYKNLIYLFTQYFTFGRSRLASSEAIEAIVLLLQNGKLPTVNKFCIT